jgi:hypothetical protein
MSSSDGQTMRQSLTRGVVFLRPQAGGQQINRLLDGADRLDQVEMMVIRRGGDAQGAELFNRRSKGVRRDRQRPVERGSARAARHNQQGKARHLRQNLPQLIVQRLAIHDIAYGRIGERGTRLKPERATFPHVDFRLAFGLVDSGVALETDFLSRQIIIAPMDTGNNKNLAL